MQVTTILFSETLHALTKDRPKRQLVYGCRLFLVVWGDRYLRNRVRFNREWTKYAVQYLSYETL